MNVHTIRPGKDMTHLDQIFFRAKNQLALMVAAKKSLLEALHERVRQAILEQQPLNTATVQMPMRFLKGPLGKYNREKWAQVLSMYNMRLTTRRTDNGVELKQSEYEF